MRHPEGPDGLLVGAVGMIAAIVLGMLLVPMREATVASNLTYPFLALVIAVGETGGAWAAVGTALASALTLNFFLTMPYLSLAIEKRDDVWAFLGLAGCGLVAAAFRWRRERARAVREELHLLQSAAARLDRAGELDARASDLLDGLCEALPVAAARIRASSGAVMVATGREAAGWPAPERLLDPSPPLLARPETDLPSTGDGVRIPLRRGHDAWGWLDLWTREEDWSPRSRLTLLAFARILGRFVP